MLLKGKLLVLLLAAVAGAGLEVYAVLDTYLGDVSYNIVIETENVSVQPFSIDLGNITQSSDVQDAVFYDLIRSWIILVPQSYWPPQYL